MSSHGDENMEQVADDNLTPAELAAALRQQIQAQAATLAGLARRNDILEQQRAQDRVDMANMINRFNRAGIPDGPGLAVDPAAAAAAAAAANAAAAAAAAAGAVYVPRPALTPVPRLPSVTYEGKDNDDWHSFRKSFLLIARFQRYTDEEAKLALLACMRGQAFLAVATIPVEDPAMTLENVLTICDERFLPPAASDRARSRYETCVQGPKEEVINYHSRMFTLYCRAYPDNVGGNYQQLIRDFTRGLNRKRLREQVLRTSPQTWPDALNAAQREVLRC
ncbi:unnamed protein product [Sphagnum tenellum]